tara:strand:- start:58 stop:279 length:222 start_codon:yes stop_codon:yes gene_type:complete
MILKEQNLLCKLTMKNKTKVILFFMITGWLRVLAIVIPGVWIYINTGEWRQQTNTEEQVITESNDNLSTLKIE